MTTNVYLIQALRAYREAVPSQFGESDTGKRVQLTQDAADEIQRLAARVAELEKGLVISFDGTNKLQGLVGGVSWLDVRRLVGAEKAMTGISEEIATFIAKPNLLEIVFK